MGGVSSQIEDLNEMCTENQDKCKSLDKYCDFILARYDSEIKLLWQRSVFVATFMVLVVTGYGVLFLKMREMTGNWHFLLFDEVYNGVSICICLVGVLLAFIWYRIARGSKACFESYEDIIYKQGKGIIDRLGQREMDDLKYEKHGNFNSCLGAGPFSVGRLNVLIPFSFMLLFSVLCFSHLIMLCTAGCCWGYCLFPVLFPFLLFVSAIVVLFCFAFSSKSEWLSKKTEQKESLSSCECCGSKEDDVSNRNSSN